MTLRRPIVLLVLAAMLPLVLLSAGLGAAWLSLEQGTMERDATARVEHIAALVERELAAEVELLQLFAESRLFDGPLDAAAAAIDAERVRRGQPRWMVLVISDPAGNRLVDVPRPVGGAPGKVVEMDSHARAVETRRPTVGTIRRGPQGQAAFAVRVPVIRDDRVVYVVSAVIEPDALRRLLLEDRLPDEWIGLIVDGDGLLVARSTAQEAMVARPVSAQAREARARGPAGIYEGRTQTENMPMMVAYRLLPDSNWSVHVAIPRDLYRAPLERAFWLAGGGGLVSLVLAGSFLGLITRELKARRREQDGVAEVRRLEALGRMTGGVAHDFNNLLMIVQGTAEILRRRTMGPEEITVFTTAMLGAVERGQSLTRQLLAFARRSPYEALSFDPKERAEALRGLLARSARGDIVTVLAMAEYLWPVHADPNALDVALVNLAVNARDAMPKGGTLTVTVRNVTLDAKRTPAAGLTGDFVAFSVRDTGEGMAPETLAQIFEPFYTTKPKGQGVGLGLSQVYGFARQSGGAVTVESAVGAGSTFTIYLPRAAEAPAVPVAPVEAPQSLTDSGNLLLIEDDAQVAEVAGGMLAAAGYHVTWVAGADAALEVIDRGEPFDVVLSDIVMPGGLSGLDLAPQIRERRPNLPVVLMTGYSEGLIRGVPCPFTVLSKPFSQADAVTALRQARYGPG